MSKDENICADLDYMKIPSRPNSDWEDLFGCLGVDAAGSIRMEIEVSIQNAILQSEIQRDVVSGFSISEVREKCQEFIFDEFDK